MRRRWQGGGSEARMVACIAPHPKLYPETLHTLSYAAKARPAPPRPRARPPAARGRAALQPRSGPSDSDMALAPS